MAVAAELVLVCKVADNNKNNIFIYVAGCKNIYKVLQIYNKTHTYK